MLFHGDCREAPIGPAPVALPLYRMINRRSGALRFQSHEVLCGGIRAFSGDDRGADRHR
jgi:hypothetical protein